ncbi:MAG: ABC transporter substrate-binding protein [Deltaproteobacteria bacterium]|nr:ABC transporter substrate-binding protein [Deltaproteobacteria bacterium]
MKKLIILTALSAIFLLLAFACGESSTPSAPSGGADSGSSSSAAPSAGTASTGAPGQPKVLNFGVFASISSLEPTTDWDSWYIVRIGVGETLVRFNKTMGAEPWLAESFSVAPDNLTWTFKIRDNVKFSNGKPVDAAAVKASFERVDKLAQERFKSEFFTYESLEADGQNFIIKTVDPTPGLAGMLADPLFLVVDAEANPEKVENEGVICTGPYKYLPRNGENISAVRNDLYWDGKPPFDQVNFVTITDPNTRAMALQSGDVDLAANMSTSDVPLFLSNPDFTVSEIQSLRVVMAFMNLDNKVLADENLRKAVKSSLDLKTYADKILGGRFAPGKGPLPPSLGYGFDSLVDPFPFDMEKAKGFLEAAGYTDTNGDGTVDKDGAPLVLNYVYYSSRAEFPLLVEATQHALESLGVKVNLNQVEASNLNEIRKTRDYDLLVMNIITAGTGDPQSFLVSQFETGAFNNSNGYSNTELDALFEKLKLEFDAAEREKLITKSQELIIEVPAHIFYAYPNTNIVYNNRVTGVEMLPADYYWITKDLDLKS